MDFPKKGLNLVSGPSKSGKSVFAEKLFLNTKDVTYIATSVPIYSDVEWISQIQKHKDRRPKSWALIEENKNISSILHNLQNKNLLIDSLGGIVTSCIDLENDDWNETKNLIINSINNYNGIIVMVVEETGWTLLPPTEIGIRFIERMGEITQALEYISVNSWLIIHGRVLDLKELALAKQ